MALSLNPTLTTNAAGTFSADTTGYIQGDARDDPSARNWLSGGVVAPANALSAFPLGSPTSVWGGMGISEFIPTGYITGAASGPKALGSFVLPATSIGTGSLPLTGFAVFNQMHHMITTPQSQVPQALPGMSCGFYRFGTNARVPLACDPSLISVQGGLVTQQVSWDFVAQRLIPFVAAYAANAITAASYNNSTGAATYTTTSAHGLAPGQDVTISGITPAGYNGSFTLLSGTTGSTLVAQLASGLGLGNATAFGTLNAGGGVLPIRQVINVMPTNCMTVVADAFGNTNWNRNGACALVLL